MESELAFCPADFPLANSRLDPPDQAGCAPRALCLPLSAQSHDGYARTIDDSVVAASVRRCGHAQGFTRAAALALSASAAEEAEGNLGAISPFFKVNLVRPVSPCGGSR